MRISHKLRHAIAFGMLALTAPAIAKAEPQPEVHIRPNKTSQYAVFANVLSSSKRLGLTKIAVIGAEQFVQ